MAGLPVGVVGAGRMGGALVRGWVKGRLLRPDQIWVFDTLSQASASLAKGLRLRQAKGLEELARASRTVVLAVKPKDMRTCLNELGPWLTGQHLVVSIAAGLRLDVLSEMIPGSSRLVRVMPNVAALVGEAASAYCLGRKATGRDAAWVEKLLSGVGLALRVEEGQMDGVTGLSGSGPAYAFVMIDALADAGVLEGLSRDVAIRLAAQTLLGAGKMVLATGKHPCQLKDEVTSPGGTTARGLRALASEGVRGALMRAVADASERSRELSR